MTERDFVFHDPLYGSVNAPEWLRPVLFSPELQRLRGIRLLNTTSPSCSGLSDARRFTHTLGVLFLALRLVEKITRNFSSQEARTFLVSALLHDVGTPAFGHLFEYQLAAIKGWNHQRFVAEIIRGTYRPEKRWQQIYYGNKLRLHQVLKDIAIDPEAVVSLINGTGPLGQLLAGYIDLDNIDNVFRMASLLGFQPDMRAPLKLVDSITPTREGLMFEKEAFEFLELWQDLRKRTYEILVFDEQCLSGQAMLTDCFSGALKSGDLGERHWPFTDEEMLDHLYRKRSTKQVIKRFSVGDFYHPVFLGWYSCGKGNADLRHHEARGDLSQKLREVTKVSCSPYVFYDSGTFSKRLTLTFRMGLQTQEVELGEKSVSTVVSIFSQMRIGETQTKKFKNVILECLSDYGLHRSCLKPIPFQHQNHEVPRQRTIPF
ncbi:MAG TPA: HD domain-containing protein [Pyrinomonadaceae bacterium]|nr:HD domain-containing protein [Pyrinomonadaceae bacterium]